MTVALRLAITLGQSDPRSVAPAGRDRKVLKIEFRQVEAYNWLRLPGAIING